jgi:hypothetical protein
MKNLITLIAFIFSVSLSAQYFETTDSEVTNGPKMTQGKFKTMSTTAVAQKEGTAAELYQKAINWVNENYKSPEDVIKGKIENEYLKINGSLNDLMYVYVLGRTMTYDGRYTMEFRFRDGRFKADVVSLEIFIPSSEYTVGGWQEYGFNYKLFNRKNKPDKGGQASYDRASTYFNGIIDDIVNYTQGDSNSAKSDDDW